MMDRRVQLQVKIAGLAAEARRIRKAEQHLLSQARKGKRANSLTHDDVMKDEVVGRPHAVKGNYLQYEEIHHHRTLPLRQQLRCCNLALAFLRGRDYKQVEAKTHEEKVITAGYQSATRREIERLVLKFGTPIHYEAGGDPNTGAHKALRARFSEWFLPAK